MAESQFGSTIDHIAIANRAADDLKLGGNLAMAQDFRLATLHLSRAAQGLSVLVQQMTRRDLVQTENIRALKERIQELEERIRVGEAIDTRSIQAAPGQAPQAVEPGQEKVDLG